MIPALWINIMYILDDGKEFVLHDDVAMLHVATMKKLRDKAKLVTDIGPYRQALSASKDLSIR